MITGMSGVGKTHTLLGVVDEVIRRKKQQDVAGVVVLYCASYASMEHILRQLHSRADPLNMLAVADPSYLAAEYRPHTFTYVMHNRRRYMTDEAYLTKEIEQVENDMKVLFTRHGRMVAGMSDKHRLLDTRLSRLKELIELVRNRKRIVSGCSCIAITCRSPTTSTSYARTWSTMWTCCCSRRSRWQHST